MLIRFAENGNWMFCKNSPIGAFLQNEKNPYLYTMEKPNKPYDHPRIFWDVDYTKLDFELRANFIIERVFERGDVQDIRNCRQFYGEEKVVETLLSAKYLTEHTLYFVSTIFDIPKDQFRCYSLKQLNPELFPY